MNCICLHVHDGRVWSSAHGFPPADTGLAPAAFLAGRAWRGVSVRLATTPGNAALAYALHKVAAEVRLARPTPAAEHPAVTVGFLKASREGVPLLEADVPALLLLGLPAGPAARKLLERHPAWPALAYSGGDRDAQAEVLRVVGDPRWWLHPRRHNRLSRLFSRFRLKPESVRRWRQGGGHRDFKSLLAAWGGPGSSSWFAGLADARVDQDAGLVIACRKFLELVVLVWRDSRAQGRHFVPEYFFRDRRQAASFAACLPARPRVDPARVAS